MTRQPSGWRPTAPANATTAWPQTVTGNRAPDARRAVAVRDRRRDQTGVDFAERRRLVHRASAASSAAADRPARPQRARDRAPLHPPVAAELRDRPRPVPARLVHDEAQPAPQREDGAAAGLRRHPPAAAAGDGAGRAAR